MSAKRILSYLMLSIFIWILIEVSLRLIIVRTWSVPFFKPSDIIYAYYPQIPPIRGAEVKANDDRFDLLILSCSVLHEDWGDFNSLLEDDFPLPPRFSSVRIHNASGIGHGSLDNYIKYALLGDVDFDAVMYYDAINDARLNNCPSEVYKSDYSHYQWYREIQIILKHRDVGITVMPLFLELTVSKLSALLRPNRFIPVDLHDRPDWYKYGSEYKSLNGYLRHMDMLLTEIERRGLDFFYFSFAYHLTKDYDRERFYRNELDYTFCSQSREVETWGTPANVSGFIDSVNLVMDSIIDRYHYAHYVGLHNSIPRDGRLFADICHFSPIGMELFSDSVKASLAAFYSADN